jgi:hypothetical protein
MPCKIKIKKLLEDLVQQKTEQGLTMKLSDAKTLAVKTNLQFASHVVSFSKVENDIVREINIHPTLVDRYYTKQLLTSVQKIVDEPSLETSSLPNTMEIDLNNLNLTSDVVNYLYADSRLKYMGASVEQYNIELTKLINNLRASFTNKEILEKIKCI